MSQLRKAIFMLLFVPAIMLGQKLEKNEIDEFENKLVKETSWVTFTSTSDLFSYVRLRQVGDKFYFNIKMMKSFSGAYGIDSGENFLIKFSDDEIVRLHNPAKTFTSIGGGAIGLNGSKALGIELHCDLPKEILEKLKDKIILKVRVYTSDGYFETKVNSRQSKRINELANLIL